MAIQQGQCTVFKKNCLSALENFAVGTPYTYKIALYTSFADIGPNTLIYSATNEITGTGYTAGGQSLTVTTTPTTGGSDNVAYISFANISWTGALTARGALIYDVTNGNKTVCILDFGSDKTSTTTFTVQFPAATNTSAIIRIA